MPFLSSVIFPFYTDLFFVMTSIILVEAIHLFDHFPTIKKVDIPLPPLIILKMF